MTHWVQDHIIYPIKVRIYKRGGRPKPGSIWYSPSLSYIAGLKELYKDKE